MKIYLDGSCIDGKVGAAAVMFKQGEEICILRKHVGDECQHIVYKAEVIGLTLAAKMFEERALLNMPLSVQTTKQQSVC